MTTAVMAPNPLPNPLPAMSPHMPPPLAMPLKSDGPEEFSNVTAEQMATLRNGAKPEHAHLIDDAMLKRFVRATDGNLPLSIKRLNATCDWRAQAKPESVVCAACAKNSRSHYMHVVGHDLLGRPIIYSCLALAENKVYEDNRDHMIQTFETAIKCMPPGVEQWVWVCDFEGFGMSDALNVKIAKAFLDISAAHYPERLGQFVLLDAPPLFSMLWKAIQSFVDPKTHKKIRFVPYDANSKKAAEPGGGQFARLLAESFDETTQAWLAREVAENRDKRVAKTKHYHVGNIHRAASAGQLQGLCKQLSSNVVEVRQNIANSREGTSGHGPERYSHSRSEDGTASGHDARGTCTLLQMYQDQPAILEPQALVMRGKQSV
mmetsp:Transcript_26261/g.78003  ORF Transcript_26261/g.78003 Transcript_26261/m.78003 type:complete len:376 (-) Transcript_26261:341-1468(-)